MMVRKGNHPQMAQQFRLVKDYSLPTFLLPMWNSGLSLGICSFSEPEVLLSDLRSTFLAQVVGTKMPLSRHHRWDDSGMIIVFEYS